MVTNPATKARAERSAGGPSGRDRGGFTLVEVIIAITILAFGLLGMAGTTALVVRQVTLADVATERSAALQTTIESLRALPFDSLAAGSDSVGITTSAAGVACSRAADAPTRRSAASWFQRAMKIWAFLSLVRLEVQEIVSPSGEKVGSPSKPGV